MMVSIILAVAASITLDQKTQQVEPRRAHREPLKVPLREPPRSTPRSARYEGLCGDFLLLVLDGIWYDLQGIAGMVVFIMVWHLLQSKTGGVSGNEENTLFVPYSVSAGRLLPGRRGEPCPGREALDQFQFIRQLAL